MKLSRKVKDILFVVYLLACLTLAIGGLGWSDYAETSFWAHAWNVLSGVGVVGVIGGVWWKSKQREPVKPNQ
jgi:hypothetical protein